MRRYLGKNRLVRGTEAIMIAIGALGLSIVFNELDAFDRVVAFMERHEAWELDEYFFAACFIGIGMLFIAIRRARELSAEIGRRQRAEARAASLARHDPLTGLANRRLMGEALPSLIAEARAARREAAVLAVDLDHFKPVNDVHGHETGDAVLVEVAARLARVCGPDRLVARTGGDEFVVVIADAEDGEAVSRTAGAIIRALSEPYRVDERRIDIGATIGIARCPADSCEPEQMLRLADVAMYEAKRAGRGNFRFFQAEMDARLRARAELERDLREAIETGQVVPYFQPVMQLSGSKVIGFEALARWIHPTRGLISPDDFVPIAEDNGLIDRLTASILRQSCQVARGWPAELTLSVNISPIQLRDPWLAAKLLAILSETNFPPQRLIVEVTENAIIDDIDQAAQMFSALQSAGIRIALDDFGRGYSSLSHLRQLKFNHLKIDQSFVRSMDTAESRKIVSAVAGLGKALGMPVTAEGVESAEVAAALAALGCEQAQGFLFGAPEPALDAVHRLRQSEGTGEVIRMKRRAR